MDDLMKERICHLIHDIRVMTLAVADLTGPWSSPVYFVFHEQVFYFFSSESSRHIQAARDMATVSASIFQDGDAMVQIFGLQMAGHLKTGFPLSCQSRVIAGYVKKFGFLTKVFGPGILADPHFFRKKFNARLYGFFPETIFLSDNRKRLNLKGLP